MSKGYFFKLNQDLSAIENGIAIFDYIELPAYEGSNSDNPLAVQYPISVDINADAVCFKLHYCTYHYNNNESINYHQHLETSAIDQGNWSLTHVEDVILELPFTANATSKLSSVIKNSYNTEFPLKYSDNLKGYLETLIRNKYKTETHEEPLRVPIRPPEDFYSTLWLMDIYDEFGEVNVFENNDIDGRITKFLRKLILDFMFDLKHSDVFQSSSSFQRMYTGLMFDFYFSSLMHKCEFYYYRDLVTRQVNLVADDTIDRESITHLYAKELFDAQELWTNDIMNPLSESFFEHDFPDWKVQFSSMFLEKMNARKWNSWFATPEEEMRRVYFTMNEWGKPCNCNAETLSEFLDLSINEDEGIKSMVAFQQENREKVSRWFLSRYDFPDVFHIHFFKLSNLTFLALIIFLLYSLFFGGQYIEKSSPWLIDQIMKHNSCIVLLSIVLLIIRSFVSMSRAETLLSARRQLCAKRLFEIIACFCVFIFFISEIIKEESILLQLGWEAFLIWGFAILLVPFFNLINRYLICQKLEIKPIFSNLNQFIKRQFLIHPFRNMHILLPKLFASITAAWLTLSTGYVIYHSFFNVKVSLFTPIVITTIVISFTMSRISRTMPTASPKLFLFRAIEISIISYCIALVIGLVAINFVGERYMLQYCNNLELAQKKDGTSFKSDTIISNNNDTLIIRGAGNRINWIKRDVKKTEFCRVADNANNESKRLIAVKHTIQDTNHDLFIMPEFLKMFSFITMFIGIFLQMAFFDTRQMTDF